MTKNKNKNKYKDSGVNIDEGQKFIDDIKILTSSANTKYSLSNIGGFSGYVEIPKDISNPVYALACDGVGTKMRIALRADDHAQYEIRVYADAMLDIVKKWVPLTYEAFEDYRIGGTELSAKEVNLMRKLLKGEKVSFEEEGLSKREWSELQRKFEIS